MLKYNYTGELIRTGQQIVSGIADRAVSAQTTTSLNTDQKQLVINIGDYGLDIKDQQAIEQAHEEYPDAGLVLFNPPWLSPWQKISQTE